MVIQTMCCKRKKGLCLCQTTASEICRSQETCNGSSSRTLLTLVCVCDLTAKEMLMHSHQSGPRQPSYHLCLPSSPSHTHPDTPYTLLSVPVYNISWASGCPWLNVPALWRSRVISRLKRGRGQDEDGLGDWGGS